MRKVLLAGVAAMGLLAWQANGVAAQQGAKAGATTKQAAKSAKAGAKASADPDKAFVEEAASGGMLEVELGRLASNQASNDDVKKFGQRMVDDHSKANNELSALAQKKNIALPPEMSKKDKATHDRLAKLNGAAFDKAYMQDMVRDHTKDVRAFEHESKMGKDADVKAWAGQTLPTLQDHLKVAKQTASEVSSAKPAKSSKKEKK